MKRAEGLSLTVVVIAIICLLVLVVLLVIFTGKIQVFNRGVEDCQGRCVESTFACDELGGQPRYMSQCKENGAAVQDYKYCCIIDEAKQ